MPGSEAAMALEERYAALLRAHADRSGLLAASAFRPMDRDTARSLQPWPAAAAAIIGAGQRSAQALSLAFFRLLSRLELGEQLESPTLGELDGRTRDGRALESALGAVPAKVLLALKRGRPFADSARFGAFAARRFGQTSVMDAGRMELLNQCRGQRVRGWRWRSQGTCGACWAQTTSEIRSANTPFMPVHPHCRCYPEPVLEGVEERVLPQTGEERFWSMAPAEQDSALGADKAALIREGAATLDDLVQTRRSERWHTILVESSAERLRARAAG